jgi:hypothetical protein
MKQALVILAMLGFAQMPAYVSARTHFLSTPCGCVSDASPSCIRATLMTLRDWGAQCDPTWCDPLPIDSSKTAIQACESSN